MFDWSGEAGLATLFAAAFLSATVLPGSSEVVLYAFLKSHPHELGRALALATLGNTLGSLTTVALGRLIPERRIEGRAAQWVRKYGSWSLLLAWLPIIGDALCAAAGWLRLPWLRVAVSIALGKFARYLALAHLVSVL